MKGGRSTVLEYRMHGGVVTKVSRRYKYKTSGYEEYYAN